MDKESKLKEEIKQEDLFIEFFRDLSEWKIKFMQKQNPLIRDIRIHTDLTGGYHHYGTSGITNPLGLKKILLEILLERKTSRELFNGEKVITISLAKYFDVPHLDSYIRNINEPDREARFYKDWINSFERQVKEWINAMSDSDGLIINIRYKDIRT